MSEHNKAKRAIDAEIERLAKQPWRMGHKDKNVDIWVVIKAKVIIGDMIRSAQR